MQDCFRKYPEVYGAELEEEEAEGGEQAPAVDGADGAEAATKTPSEHQEQVADVSKPESAATSAVDTQTTSQKEGEGQPVSTKPAATESKPTSP